MNRASGDAPVCVPAEWLDRALPESGPAAFALLCLLSRCGGEARLQTLARLSGLSRPTVSRALRRLAGCGRVVVRSGRDGRARARVLRARPVRSAAAAAAGPVRISARRVERVCRLVCAALARATGAQHPAEAPALRRLVAAQLAEGFSVRDLLGVIRRQEARWGGDLFMKQSLNAEELFSAGAFRRFYEPEKNGSAMEKLLAHSGGWARQWEGVSDGEETERRDGDGFKPVV